MNVCHRLARLGRTAGSQAELPANPLGLDDTQDELR
jgi:hypothetical protein